MSKFDGPEGNNLTELPQRLKDNIKGKTWDELCEIWYYVECQMKGSGERGFQIAKRSRYE